MQLGNRDKINSSLSTPQGFEYQLVSGIVKGRQKLQYGLGKMVKTQKLQENFLFFVYHKNKTMQNWHSIPQIIIYFLCSNFEMNFLIASLLHYVVSSVTVHFMF